MTSRPLAFQVQPSTQLLTPLNLSVSLCCNSDAAAPDVIELLNSSDEESVVELLSDESDVEPRPRANNGPLRIASAQQAPPLPQPPAAAPQAADGPAATLASRVEPVAAVAPLAQPPRRPVAVARESDAALTDAEDEADDEGDGWTVGKQWMGMEDGLEQG
jgi:hypothetical protein